MKTKIKAIIKSLEAAYPLTLRYLQVDNSFNTGYARVAVRNTINPRVLEYDILGLAKEAGLRCTIDHNPGSIYYRLEFEKA